MEDNETPQTPEPRAFLMVILGTIGLGVAAYAFSLVLGVPMAQRIRPDINDFAIGVIATLPLAGFLWWFSNTTLEHFASFRKSQIKFFSEIGFEFTPSRIALMAVCAGISEELLFRGLLQTWIAGFAPLAVAIILSNVVFGMLHMRTILYAVIAGLVGVYLGVLFAVTDNLLAPMAAHALYDAVALEYTRRAVVNYQSGEN
ncbi:CPBP family intramembrane glutamic endopeptidase [Hyphococcus luteus]|uniref:CAAX prenyl protease 2/Lysostaphin resistance protein A-like domain-containing protein n=1 Tax=Hyphococcus luteus TaxID=2058213 RepID=A0A2S7K2R0_9PROT|nr:CPBP family intramembrane glutamic endopeptidase [Marinicaulis flavus]PQA86738.1 hypothetical protein CW354_14710 [Marinicaulis flavus]